MGAGDAGVGGSSEKTSSLPLAPLPHASLSRFILLPPWDGFSKCKWSQEIETERKAASERENDAAMISS